MKSEIRNAFLQEIRSQCTLARQAIEDMGRLLPTAYMDTHASRFWYCLQAFLAAAANISKLLWPPTGDKARGCELRTLLGIEDDSPLRARDLRNDIEHMDERLDTWAQAAEVGKNLALYVRVIQGGEAGLFGLDPTRCFLYFDANAYRVTVAGREYEILPISWAIHALAEKVDEVLNAPPSVATSPTQDPI